MRLEKMARETQKFEELKTTFAELIQSVDEVIDEFDNIYKKTSA